MVRRAPRSTSPRAPLALREHVGAAQVAYLIDRLTLRQYADRTAGTYSGGNRRKVL
jgi:hypothetical protein